VDPIKHGTHHSCEFRAQFHSVINHWQHSATMTVSPRWISMWRYSTSDSLKAVQPSWRILWLISRLSIM